MATFRPFGPPRAIEVTSSASSTLITASQPFTAALFQFSVAGLGTPGFGPQVQVSQTSATITTASIGLMLVNTAIETTYLYTPANNVSTTTAWINHLDVSGATSMIFVTPGQLQ